VWDAVKITVTKHLGSVAMGSFFVVVVQTLRVILEAYCEQVDKMGGANATVKCQMRCAKCLSACMESCIRWVNRKA